MLIVWYMNAFDYPLIVGGKPYFSPIYPFPVFYELTILFSALERSSGCSSSTGCPGTTIQ